MKVTRLLPEPALGLQLLLAPYVAWPQTLEVFLGDRVWGRWQGHCLSPQGHSCAGGAGLCWLPMGSQSCFGGSVWSLAGSPGPATGWWHTVITPWPWPSLGTPVTGCAQAGGSSSTWGAWAWAKAQRRWHLSPAGLHCHSSASPALEPQAGDRREKERRVSGGWVTTLAAPVHTGD